MIRNVGGAAILLVLATVAFRFFMSFLGGLFSILMTVLLWALIAFAVYTVFKIFFPDTLTKVKSSFDGDSTTAG